MASHAWTPIEPLADRDRNIDLGVMPGLYASWRLAKERLQASSPIGLKQFNERLIRRMSIETGIIERLYDLDRGTTETLVVHGFVEDLISRSGTDIEPSRLVDILRDQEAAVHLVMDCVAQSRELTKGVIHELHAILTRHQDTTTAMDQFGNSAEVRLLKGSYKQHPNNPKRFNGTVHEYCPSVHVDAEMEKLLFWLKGYADVDALIVAAWLHHRFTQIHPYQDGNGRLARALSSMILLRAGVMPLVIDREMKVAYITALESADSGELDPLALLFARLEREQILQALSIDVDAGESRETTLTSAVIESLAHKLSTRREEESTELRVVNALALRLRERAHLPIEAAFRQLCSSIGGFTDPVVVDGGSDGGNESFVRAEVALAAKRQGKVVNLSEDQYWVAASIGMRSSDLWFAVSFYHVGRKLSGVMEAIAFARIQSNAAGAENIEASVETLVFTYKTQEQEIAGGFDQWLDAALAVAIKEFGDRL